MSLRTEGLEFGYGSTNTLDGITLELREGELLGVVGPNGAGKSTLLACLHGALRPRRGFVFLDDVELSSLPRKSVARAIGVVPQRCEVPFPVSVESFVGLGRYAHETWLRGATTKDRAAVRRALATMELEALAQRSVNELSGGEFRRVLIAQALAQEPRILLLDEPVQQLDVLHQLEVMEFARAFTRRGGTSGVVVLHELGLAARYCDRLVLLQSGRITAAGAPEEVLTADHVRSAFGIHAEIERSRATGTIQVVAIAAAEHTDKSKQHRTEESS